MSAPPHYAPWERVLLWTLAATGLLVVNGAFLYGVFFDPGAMAEAMGNPVSVAFQVEAFLLLAALAWLLPKWGVTRLRRGWFVALSLLGSLAFALPVALLWQRRADD
jgi:hypothetical protein